MQTYESHFLLNVETVKEYVINKVNFFSLKEELEATEIGDGNINYVFKVTSKSSGKSLIVKQADKFLRSSGRPLDVYRSKIEAEILKIEGTLAKDYVPEVYFYDDIMCTLCMEDISAYKNLRTELENGNMYPGLGDKIADFMARTLLPTTDLILDKAEKKKNVKKFCNVELCDISEDLVLCEPYFDYKHRNIITQGNETFVKEHLYENKNLHCEVLLLRDTYMNKAQALVHGDLHSGSIFVNELGIKVIDPEFAFYGPMGYDIGNVIGNLFFAWSKKNYVDKDNAAFLSWISSEIKATFDMTMKNLEVIYDASISDSFHQNTLFKKVYFGKVASDSLGFAGTEMIRRVVGDSKVSELTSISNLNTRIKVEQSLIKMGIHLIMNRTHISSGQEICDAFISIISE